MNDVNYGVSDLEVLYKRLKLFTKLTNVSFIALFAALWIGPLSMLVIKGLAGSVFVCALLVAVGIAIIYATRNQKTTRLAYEKAYKEVLVAPALAKSFQNYTYHPEEGFSKNEIMRLGLWDENQGSCKISSEDFLTGIYKGVYYEQCDLTVYRRRKNDNNYRPVFNGCISKFRFEKKITGRLIIMSYGMGLKYTFNDLDDIKTENQKFNDKFNIYAEDGHDAFYVLTPHFMEYLLNLHKTVPGKTTTSYLLSGDMAIIFNGNIMTILRDKVRMFEVSLGKEFDYFKLKQDIISDMDKVLGVVDILNIGREELPQEKATQKEAVEQENKTENNGAVAKFRLK
ncbi:MAG: DUF3137 domain-containing protein [Clostridium sp.]|nr:DUF3137 domain-containing protein [Clostridium sp.]MCM1208297.1 DUF3137 domain-containing protein [Ruminococcus sp.]